ncbi:MAG: hypothetical protein AAGA73_10260, partial [Pseudomonadota bacterium]
EKMRGGCRPHGCYRRDGAVGVSRAGAYRVQGDHVEQRRHVARVEETRLFCLGFVIGHARLSVPV